MAKSFANSFLTDSIYLYIGRPTAWTTPGTPDASEDKHTDHVSIWNNMAGATRISYGDVSLGIKKIVWASGTVYEKYNDKITTLGDGTGYFVLAGANGRRVYKCLDNNGGEASTVEPTHTYTTTFRESDGYIWKYMYEISLSDFSDFIVSPAMPVPSERGVSAGPGTILNITIPANNSHGVGQNYRGSGFSNGTIGVALDPTANIGTAILSACTELVLRSDQGGLSGTDDFYGNCSIMITSGDSKGKIYNINGYSQSTKTLTLDSPVGRAAVGDSFKIGPKIMVVGDGAGLTAIGNVNGFGNLVSIDVGTIGSGYANVNSNSVSIEGVYAGTNGTGASANIYAPPFGGHGSNPASELQSKYAIVIGKLPRAGSSVDGDGLFAGYEQDYRHVGLLRNPSTPDSVVAKGDSYDLRTHLYFDSTATDTGYGDLPTTFPDDTVVTNANTGATGVVWNRPDTGSGSRHLSLVGVSGNSGLTFSDGQYVIGTGGTGVISTANLNQFLYEGKQPISSALPGQLAKYSGEIIYHEDRTLSYRHLDQQENIRFVFEF